MRILAQTWDGSGMEWLDASRRTIRIRRDPKGFALVHFSRGSINFRLSDSRLLSASHQGAVERQAGPLPDDGQIRQRVLTGFRQLSNIEGRIYSEKTSNDSSEYTILPLVSGIEADVSCTLTLYRPSGVITGYTAPFEIPRAPSSTHPRITQDQAVAFAMAEVRRRFNPGPLVLDVDPMLRVSSLILLAGSRDDMVLNLGENEQADKAAGNSFLVYHVYLAIEGPRGIGFDACVDALTGRVLTIRRGKLGPKPGDGG